MLLVLNLHFHLNTIINPSLVLDQLLSEMRSSFTSHQQTAFLELFIVP